MATSLILLPDAVLLKIFSNLYATDLHSLLSVHSRLANLVDDKYNWKHVHFGPLGLSLQHVRRFVKYLGDHTYSLNITGHVKSTILSHPKCSQCISEAFFLSMKRRCINLKDLHLNKCYIDASNTKFSCFPSSITFLSLSGSSLVNLPQVRTTLNSPFFRIEKYLPNLQHIKLDGCKSWLTHTDVALLMKACKHLTVIDLGTLSYTRNGRNSWVKNEQLCLA